MELNEQPLISVALTCYNSVPFIQACIRSIYSQTYNNYEIIIIDDCSNDYTLEILKKVLISYKLENKTKLFSHSINCGYGKSLKHAIEFGSGDLIVIVDSDDALASNDAFELLVAEHRKYPEVALIYSDYWTCNERLKPIKLIESTDLKKGQTYLGDWKNGKYIGNEVVISHVKCFKRSFYNMTEGLDGTLLKAVDKDLILKLEEVGVMKRFPVGLYYHRGHPDSISKSFKHRSKEYVKKVYDAKDTMYEKARLRREVKKNENIL